MKLSDVSALFMPIYAVALMWILLDIKIHTVPKKNKLWALIFGLLIVAFNVLIYVLLPKQIYGKMYFFVMHLPVILCFCLLTKHRGIKLIFAFLTAFFFCAPPVMILRGLPSFVDFPSWAVLLVYFVSGSLIFFCICKFFRPEFMYMLRYGDGKDFLRLCIIPLFYYLYSFIQAGYSFSISLDPATRVWISQFPFWQTLLSYYLYIYIFKAAREKQQLQVQQALADVRLQAAAMQVKNLQYAQEQTLLYRHDMRHHLALIGSYAAEGDVDKIQNYLSHVQKDLNQVSTTRFCAHETLNLLLLAFFSKAKEMGIALQTDIAVSDALPLSDTELCALFSNAVENAFKATKAITDGREKVVHLVAKTTESQFLLLVENPFSGDILFENGLPQSHEENHGFGVKSMVSLVESHHGLVTFEAKDGVFSARFIL